MSTSLTVNIKRSQNKISTWLQAFDYAGELCTSCGRKLLAIAEPIDEVGIDREEIDMDHNGIPDYMDGDLDGDGIPDYLDSDDNGNGIADEQELRLNGT